MSVMPGLGIPNLRNPKSATGPVAPRPKGVGTSSPVRTPRPKGVGGLSSVVTKLPHDSPPSRVTTRPPRGVQSSGPIRIPRPKGVGSLSSVAAPQGTANDRGGGGRSPSNLRAPGMDNQTLDLNKLQPSFDNEPRSQTNQSYLRKRPLAKVNRGFGKSKNLNSAPNAMFGEY